MCYKISKFPVFDQNGFKQNSTKMVETLQESLGIKMKKKKIVCNWSTRDNRNVKHDKVPLYLYGVYSAYQDCDITRHACCVCSATLRGSRVKPETAGDANESLIIVIISNVCDRRALLHGDLNVIERSNWEVLSLSALSMNVLLVGRVTV